MVGQVLDERGIERFWRIVYRHFARKVIVLWRKGYVTIKVRYGSQFFPASAVLKWRESGLKVRVYKRKLKGGHTVSIRCRSIEDLIKAYVAVYDLDEEVLRDIVERMSSTDTLHIIY
ncbi:MAG: hypothetical protein DRJ67_09165 [Thermoprotei archaeon]|nr:MAG: hypothetical protein DRJ67_09165 [Thermoprotei archaeon]